MPLARALEELGRIIKTLYMLRYIDDEAYRRRILTQLNRREGRLELARIIFHGKRGELRQRYRRPLANSVLSSLDLESGFYAVLSKAAQSGLAFNPRRSRIREPKRPEMPRKCSNKLKGLKWRGIGSSVRVLIVQ
jgi:Tn3 transposase DDE domain